ncbi:MAG: nitroreductase family protein [Candidatus Aerophobetes bacterium]|nr:nitroreductase family protein [Candidatus Aerophobetes bacterium]
MEVKQAIQKRRSVRSYEKRAVPEEKIKRVLEAARLAPSASNRQLWKFIVVRDETRRQEIAKAASNQSFIAEAPVVIAAVGLDPDSLMRCGVPRYAVDLAIAVDHMTLAAVEENLGTCWIGSFSQEKVKKMLNIPEKYKVVALLPLGFPADKPKVKSRRSLKEIVCYETFTGVRSSNCQCKVKTSYFLQSKNVIPLSLSASIPKFTPVR